MFKSLTALLISTVGVAATVPCASDNTLPKYCCSGIMPLKDYRNTPQCNPDWDTKEAVCRNSRLEYMCHHCMVHLPATNKWSKAHKKDELYGKCDKCVQSCMGE